MAFLFLYYFFFFFLYTRSYPCYEKREGIRKETGHTMKRQWEKNLKAADSFWYLRLNNLERLFSSRNDPFFIFCFLFFFVFSFRVTSWARVYRGDLGIVEGRKKLWLQWNFFGTVFATEISQVLNVYVLPCVVWCGVWCFMRRKCSHYAGISKGIWCNIQESTQC